MGAPAARRRTLRSLMRARLPARLFALLEDAGRTAERQRTSLYAVGGCVRDLLLDAPTPDVDLVVEGRGIRFAHAFARAHKARVTAHERFGTATVTLTDGRTLDIATARTEYYATPAALPVVAPSSIELDARRRDFTINTMAVRLNPPRFGELLDDCGGQRDLRDKTIRVLHGRSFLDDPTRLFRAIRFEQRLGFRLSRDTARLLRDAVHADLVRRLSPSRLSDAVVLALSERAPGKVLARLADCRLLHYIHPQLRWSPGLAGLLQRVERAIARQTRTNPDRPVRPWVVRGMALMDTLPIPAVDAALAGFAFPRGSTRAMRQARHEGDGLLRAVSRGRRVIPSGTCRLLRRLPRETMVFLLAKTRSAAGQRTLAAWLAAPRRAAPILTGTDLKTMGIPPGPLYTTVMDRLWDARLNGTARTEADERRLVDRLTTVTTSS